LEYKNQKIDKECNWINLIIRFQGWWSEETRKQSRRWSISILERIIWWSRNKQKTENIPRKSWIQETDIHSKERNSNDSK